MELDFPEQYRSWRSVDPVELFSLPVHKVVPEDKRGIESTLQQEARRCDWLILWLDCDREGENIAFEVIDVCTRAKKNLRVLRARFSALIPADIRRALETLVAPDKNQSDAVDARQEIDLRLGAAFTRFQTMRLQVRFPELQSEVISYGPCQFPTLGFVVHRYMQRQNFVSEPFWYLTVTVQHNGGTSNFSWSRHRLFDRASCLILYEQCIQQGSARVVDIIEKPRSRWRPIPLATIEFQKAASSLLRMSSEHAMTIAEELYTKGYISYPRTETDSFKEGTDLLGLIQEQVNDPRWGAFAQQLLNGKFQHPRNGKHDDKAHPPIHPTKWTHELSGDQGKVYEYITRRFLACCSQDALAHETSVEIVIANEHFHTSGLAISERNYLEVFTYDRWSDCTIPKFEHNQMIVPTSIDMVESKTVAPNLLSEHELISLMDSNQIGTDATVAQHISTIQKRAYAEKRENVFHPSQLGIALVASYESMSIELYKPTLRATMEADCNKIALGQKSKVTVTAECLAAMKEIFMQVVHRATVLDTAMSQHFRLAGTAAALVQANFSSCGHCGRQMDLKSEGQSQLLFCATCTKSYDLPKFGALSATNHACAICRFQVIESSNEERGTKFNFCPFCYSNPPAEQAGGSFAQGFTCRSCTHATCPLARGTSSTPVCPCPKCRSRMLTIKRRDNGAFYLSCKYPDCTQQIVPPGCTSLSVADEICANCTTAPVAGTDNNGQAHLLNFVFRASAVPPHLQHSTLCILCDPELSDLCTFSGGSGGAHAAPGRAPPANLANSYQNMQRGLGVVQPRVISAPRADHAGSLSLGASVHRASSASSNGFGGGGAGDAVQCYKCKQYGHFATNCPSRGDAFDGGRPSAPSGNGNGDAVQCYKCKQYGHFATNCPSKGDSFDARPSSAPAYGQAAPPQSAGSCFKCGQTGICFAVANLQVFSRSIFHSVYRTLEYQLPARPELCLRICRSRSRQRCSSGRSWRLLQSTISWKGR
jgi:DNA topoisomerase-3